MAENSGGNGTGGVAAVAIVMIVVLAVLAGGAMFFKGGGFSPGHAISGAVSTPVGVVTGHASGH